MKKAITRKTSHEELAALIISTLSDHGISAVLTGGSVVSIYTDNAYESRDLDFISPASQKEIAAAMATLGFKRKGKDFVSDDTEFTLEFSAGPLAIGNRVPIEPEGERVYKGIRIRLLSPTQSVMDRLCWFYHYNDRQCLDQAVLICLHQPVNLEEVRRWSTNEENAADRFEFFMNVLKERKQRTKRD